jgi:hypothetical protein
MIVFFELPKRTSFGVLTVVVCGLLCRDNVPSMVQEAVVTVLCETS